MMEGWGTVMGLGWLIPLLLVVILFYIFNNKRDEFLNEESALDILDKKYARGEISEEEYKRKKEHLKN